MPRVRPRTQYGGTNERRRCRWKSSRESPANICVVAPPDIIPMFPRKSLPKCQDRRFFDHSMGLPRGPVSHSTVVSSSITVYIMSGEKKPSRCHVRKQRSCWFGSFGFFFKLKGNKKIRSAVSMFSKKIVRLQEGSTRRRHSCLGRK